MTPAAYHPPLATWELPRDEVHVWSVSIAPLPADFGELESVLSTDERERAARFHFEADQHRHIIGRGWLRRLLGICLQVSPRELRFSYGQQGKPELDEPTASGLSFNLSHSHECILIALAWSNVLGVDVEFVRSMSKALTIGRRHFTPEECRLLDGEEQARDESFFRLWARKEAVIKAVGTGLTMPLNRFDVSSSASTEDGWRTVSVSGERPSQWAVSDLPAPIGYRAALAAGRRPANLCFWQA